MKKTFLFALLTTIALAGAIQMKVNAQDTLVQWTFPGESGEADGGVIPGNLLKVIETAGGTSEIQFKNGCTTKAAQATGWDEGAENKSWTVEFETTGYGSIKLSSKITSGGQNPGPRDFKVQYKIGESSWTDIENSDFQTANDWTTGVLFELPVPNECSDQSLVNIRWIMTTDTAADGSVVNPEGISKIDDIFITGEIINGADEMVLSQGIKMYPNPADDYFVLESSSAVQIDLYSGNGEKILSKKGVVKERIDISGLKPGTYLLKVTDEKTRSSITQKMIIQ